MNRLKNIFIKTKIFVNSIVDSNFYFMMKNKVRMTKHILFNNNQCLNLIKTNI